MISISPRTTKSRLASEGVIACLHPGHITIGYCMGHTTNTQQPLIPYYSFNLDQFENQIRAKGSTEARRLDRQHSRVTLAFDYSYS
jgi:hypothetical protein